MKRNHQDRWSGGSVKGECSSNGKAKMWEEGGGGGTDELLEALGYRVRASDMADVAQKLEQLEMVMGSAQEDGISHLASDTVHYDPTDLYSWVQTMLTSANTNTNNILDPSSLVIDGNNNIMNASAPVFNDDSEYDLRAIPGIAAYPQPPQPAPLAPPTPPQDNKNNMEEIEAANINNNKKRLKTCPVSEATRSVMLVDSQEAGVRLVHTLLACAEAVQQENLKLADALEQALRAAETETARNVVLQELKGEAEDGEGEDEAKGAARVPVVRLRIGEVAEATSVVVLPVTAADEREVLDAPLESRSVGEFGVVVAEKAWGKWVVLPRWDPIVGLTKGSGGGGVVVSFPDARVLPWKVNRWYKEEPILVVVDRSNTEVGADDGFYLVNSDDNGGLKVERGFALKENSISQSLGNVLLVVRPPKEENDELSEEDWD